MNLTTEALVHIVESGVNPRLVREAKRPEHGELYRVQIPGLPEGTELPIYGAPHVHELFTTAGEILEGEIVE